MTKTEHKYRICPKCDYYCNVLEDNKFCLKCGEELIEQCPKCNSKIVYPFANYCGICGERYREKNNDSLLKL